MTPIAWAGAAQHVLETSARYLCLAGAPPQLPERRCQPTADRCPGSIALGQPACRVVQRRGAGARIAPCRQAAPEQQQRGRP